MSRNFRGFSSFYDHSFLSNEPVLHAHTNRIVYGRELQHNKFRGSLDPLQGMVKLRGLSIHDNNFTGTLQALQESVNLRILYAGQNKLDGDLTALRNMAEMREL